MAVFAFHNTHDLHQLSFFNGESTSSATPPPKRAVNSCGIENILEITDACGSGNPKSNGTAICATPMYRIYWLPQQLKRLFARYVYAPNAGCLWSAKSI